MRLEKNIYVLTTIFMLSYSMATQLQETHIKILVAITYIAIELF